MSIFKDTLSSASTCRRKARMSLAKMEYSFSIFIIYLALGPVAVTPAVHHHHHHHQRKVGIQGKSWETSNASLGDHDTVTSRDPKFFPILSFVTLPASTCQTDMGALGTCITNNKCTRQGGTAMGSCSGKFGVCCIINLTCASSGNVNTVTANGTHLVQPSSFVEMCRYEIPKKEGVCQIRLDFNEFSTVDGMSATETGNCNVDTFTVSGASNGIVGPLCGDLKGQHMYLDYGPNDKINLDFFTQAQMSQKWDISVTMIRCDSLNRAPDGCLQYYTTTSGMVKSFDYNNKIQLNNQDYTVCVRAQAAMRKITWKPCMTNPTVTTDFIITGVGDMIVTNPPAPAIGVPEMGSDCLTDWVMVLGQNKYCGTQFPDSVSTTTQPFILQVHFNEQEVITGLVPPPCPDPTPCPLPPEFQPDTKNTGFCLKYSLSPY